MVLHQELFYFRNQNLKRIIMQRKEILVHGWDFAYDVEGWYPPLKAALKDVDFEHALWKAEGKSSHTIAELVSHLLYYKKRFLFRLERKSWPSTINTNDDTFRTTEYSSSETWGAALKELDVLQKDIRTNLEKLKDNDLDSPLPDAPIGGQVLSLFMHDAYHTGQIVQLRKLYGSWPETREV